ncbi:MAG: transcriptional activator RfaH [Chitinophagaceae bacterium]|nr:transcriptional activator RfaH [Chitinophagaceae bacterium]
MNTVAAKKWYVLYTKPRWEKKIDQRLQNKGIESWCPTQKVERQWSDRKKVIEDPLFKSYVFVHIAENEKLAVLQTEGVLNFIHHVGKPAVVRDEEVNLIKSYLLQKDVLINVQSASSFEAETKIKVTKGVFMNQTGTVLKNQGRKKVFVSLESIGQVMIVEFPAEYLEPFNENKKY